MTTRIILFVSFLLILVTGCDKYDLFEDYPKIGASEHFVIGSKDQFISPEEIDLILQDLEAAYDLLNNFLGPAHSTDKTFTVALEGDFNPDFGIGGHVDEFGYIRLYRMPEEEGGYLAHTDHELVHAFRFQAIAQSDKIKWANMPFLEEGLAEYFSIRFFSEKNNFSTYDLPLEVVAAFWLQYNPALDLQEARTKHLEFNQFCSYQIYPLRASWIAFIHDEFGKEKLLELVFPDQSPNDDFLLNLLGKNYAQLDQDWKVAISRKVANISNLDSLYNNYQYIIEDYSACDF